MTPDTNSELAELLKTYPANVQDVAREARQIIIDTIPELLEMVDRPARVIGYGFGPGYKDMICTIILSKTGVKLGIVGSADLPDPNGLLEGAGKRHRYVALAKPSDVRKPGLKTLLKARVVAWRKSQNL
jgi:hypothetical protein